MYYGIVVISVVMFGIQFLFSDRYEKESGNGAGAVFIFNLLSAAAGLVCLFAINGFLLELTWFTLLAATLAALNSLLFSVCSLKALSKINLSLYSLFSMLGGMMLPFFAGMLFYDERMTLGKGVCVVLVIAALLLTVTKERKKGGWIYYCGIFVLNGMSGVISKFFESAPYPKTSAAGYSIWIAIITAVFSGIALLCVRKKLTKPSGKAVWFALGGGALSKVANYLLLIALLVLPASVQYPFVTGGVMIVSTLIAALTGQKPSKKEVLAVGLSFAGILALILL